MINKKAFTLLELIIAVTILALVSIVAIPNLIDAIRGARENSLIYNISALKRSIDKFYSDTGAFPRSLQVLELEGYIAEIPIDPTTGKKDWEIAINIWPQGSDGYINGWVVDADNGVFHGADFIAPAASYEPYYDDPPDGTLRYRSMRGICNIRSRKRIQVDSTILWNSPFVDPYHNSNVLITSGKYYKNLGRPLYQYWRVNRNKDTGANIHDEYPYFVIEGYMNQQFPQGNPDTHEVDFPARNFVFDKNAGNYEFNLWDTVSNFYNKGYDTAEVSSVDYYY